MAAPETEAAKQLAEQGPFVWNNLIPSLWMMLIAMAGGYVSFRRKMASGAARGFNITELIGEMVTSAFVGLATFWLCRGFDVNPWLTAAGVAISGHMGARAIFLAEQKLTDIFDRIGK